MLKTKVVSCMEKCFIDQKPEDFKGVSKIRMYKNERASVQFLVYESARKRVATLLKMEVESELKENVTLRTVENIPNYNSYYQKEEAEKYGCIRITPGLYPDVLMPLMRGNCVPCYNKQLHSVMIDFEGDLKAGKYPVKIVLYTLDEKKVAESEFVVEIIDALLPEQETIVTNWFYADCLADYYNVEVFSDRHFEICENYIKTAVKNGTNMLLMPVFTPPLDTYVGGERTTVQLVKIDVKKGKYYFDFSLVDRWIEMCNRCNIKYLEICHLFTQWGAYHAPKIMATVDGEYKRIFGWETDSAGDEYVKFIRQFLTEFTAYLEKRGDKERTYFHISDEPNEKHIEQYRKNKKNVMDILKGFKVMDALSRVEFYKEGLCEIPVPQTTKIEPFMAEDIKERWVYYCCGPLEGTNRGFSLPTPRTRSLGMQMYKYGIKGFLHWGYNYYNNQISYDNVNPFLNPCGGYFGDEIGGDCHEVYPAQDGTAFESLRLMAARLAFDDIRLFKLCESYYEKERVVSEIEKITGNLDFEKCVNDVETMQKIRDRMDDMIISKIK